jgi:ATP-dependent Clp protease ATP-binding subunit ClpA
VTIEEKSIERAVVLSADYILNERLPTKAIKILRRVCEDIDYERTQHEGKSRSVTASDVIRVVAEITGVPEGTLSGVGDKEVNYENALSQEVIGQEEAVKAVATELHLIKAGLTEPGKPASVMFFAGLTGVGKTELAKTLARFYSSSKRLQTYTMGNFTESHSISGIIGVPPGYVGHEQGGRLINDLNSDPYCVFLLDEAEKAHPDIWKPFLNLFDEGWIVDQRGVKGFADRAIFILTSNAGHEIISNKSQAGERMDKITEAVKDTLSKVKREGSAQPVFPPEFLARIRQIIVFKPLDEDAMKGICKKLAARMRKDWKEKREKKIVIPENLIEYIAKQSHLEDKKSGFKEGGRIVRKMLRDLVEAPIQHEASQRESEYKTCDIIELAFLPPVQIPYQSPPVPQIIVEFRIEKSLSPAECLAQIASMLKQDLLQKKEAASSTHQVMADSLSRLDAAMKCWSVEHAGEASGVPDGLLDHFRKAYSDLELVTSHSEQQSRAIVEELITIMERGTE